MTNKQEKHQETTTHKMKEEDKMQTKKHTPEQDKHGAKGESKVATNVKSDSERTSMKDQTHKPGAHKTK